MARQREVEPKPERGEYVERVSIRGADNNERITVEVKQERTDK